MSRVRCFVAVDLPAAVRTDLGALQDRLRGVGKGIRWVAPGSVHLTLKFLGEVPADVFQTFPEQLCAPVPVGPGLDLEPAGVGAFPNLGRPRVLWVGVDGDVPALARAAMEIEARAERIGIPRERRPFRPHLTLGRVKEHARLPALEDAIRAEGGYRGPAFLVRELVLFQSELGPTGARYTAHCGIPLC